MTKNHSKKNWFLQSCDSCDQRNEKMEDRMISSFEPTGLVFIVPHRHDKPKQSTCLFYQSIKNHSKNHDLRIIDNQEMMTIQEVTWRRYLESIRTSGRNARGMENITRTHEHIARNYIKLICTYVPEDKEWFEIQLTHISDKNPFVGLKFSQPKIPKILMSSNRQKKFDGMFRMLK